jgi:hypothetical protein
VRIGWTAAGADEAFLWLDRDHDGKVGSGAELFGTATPLKNGQPAKNGFQALREFDTNGDGVITSRDDIWSQLQLWRDTNHNGISEPSETTPIARSGVYAFGLAYRWTGRRDQWGNSFKYESFVLLEDERRRLRVKALCDIFFVPVR